MCVYTMCVYTGMVPGKVQVLLKGEGLPLSLRNIHQRTILKLFTPLLKEDAFVKQVFYVQVVFHFVHRLFRKF